MTVPLFEQPWPEGDYRFFQLGIVVDDLLAASRRWVDVHGVGPFHVLPSRPSRSHHKGVETTIQMQVSVAQAGPVQIELIKQHCETPSIFRDHLTGGHAGLHQVCTVTHEYDAKVAHLVKSGYEVAAEIDTPGRRVAYVDTFADFGFFTEIVESGPAFLEQLAIIGRTCADWDGTTDPIRLLTRDGYRTP